MFLLKLTRRTTVMVLCFLTGCVTSPSTTLHPAIDRAVLLSKADEYLSEVPVTITAFPASRSAGGAHDYFSEGSYWWPDPDHPDGPYIRRDGFRNPNNFNGHRNAMKNLQRVMTTLLAAYKATGNETYAFHAVAHLRAWFVSDDTRMNPHLLYAQAIKGRLTGRGIGIIDTVKLIEVALAAMELERLGILRGEDLVGVKSWFTAYVDWLNTHPYGLAERDHGNNHSTWWAAQVAAFASFTKRDDLLQICQQRYKTMLRQQMAKDGSFPKELDRTRPFAYSLYNLDAFAALARLASTKGMDLWNHETSNGSLRKAVDFMTPYLQNLDDWPREPDVTGFENFPQRRNYQLFAAQAYQDQELFNLWETLPDGSDPAWHVLTWMDEINPIE